MAAANCPLTHALARLVAEQIEEEAIIGLCSSSEAMRAPRTCTFRAWPTAAPDVCDGTSAAGESRHPHSKAHPLVNRLNLA